jgi:hypothetical protein
MFLCLLDPDLDPLVRGMDPDTDPSIKKQKYMGTSCQAVRGWGRGGE